MGIHGHTQRSIVFLRGEAYIPILRHEGNARPPVYRCYGFIPLFLVFLIIQITSASDHRDFAETQWRLVKNTALRILGLSMAGVGPDTETQGSGLEPNPVCLRARILRADQNLVSVCRWG